MLAQPKCAVVIRRLNATSKTVPHAVILEPEERNKSLSLTPSEYNDYIDTYLRDKAQESIAEIKKKFVEFNEAEFDMYILTYDGVNFFKSY